MGNDRVTESPEIIDFFERPMPVRSYWWFDHRRQIRIAETSEDFSLESRLR